MISLKLIPRLSKNRVQFIICISALIALSVFLHLRLINNASDDAYIHMRIGRNFALYGQPYFNLNNPVLASSSILWTLLIGLVFLEFPIAAQTIAVVNGAFLVLGGVILTLGFIRITNSSSKPLFYISFFIIEQSIAYLPSIALMETSFAIFLMGLAIYCYLNKKLVGVYFLGLLPFVRLEFAFFSMIMIGLSLYTKRWKPIHIILITLLGIFPIIWFLLHHYSQIIPNTVLAKSIIYGVSSVENTLQITSDLVNLNIPNNDYLIIFFPIVVFMLILITYFLSLDIKSSKGDLRDWNLLVSALFISSIATMFTYIISGNQIFTWYKPLYLLPIVFTLLTIISSRKNIPLILLLILITGSHLINMIKYSFEAVFSKISLPQTAEAARVENYLRIGKMLNDKYPGKTLLTSEVGALGFSFEGEIFDGAGLISPDALKFHPMSVPEERDNEKFGAIPYRYIQEKQPDIIVSYDVFIKQFLISELRRKYLWIEEPALLPRDMARFDGVFGCDTLNIFIRKQ